MDHYATLGCPREATADEIKTAYRHASRRHHPDHGGDASVMATVNRAWEVLGDPERRAAYDAGHGDAPPKDPDADPRLLMLQAVNQAMDLTDGNIVDAARNLLHGHKDQARTARSTALSTSSALLRISGRVTVAEGENLVQGLIDQRLAACDAIVTECDRRLAVVARALELLQAYSDSYEPPPPTVTQFNFAPRW